MSSFEPLFVLDGVVVRGKGLGSGLGIPTANIPYLRDRILLDDGVYVGDLVLMDQGGRTIPGVLNQGYHPTLPEGDPSVEIHLFDFDENIYGQRVQVRYLHFIRPEYSYDTKAQMMEEIWRDVQKARQWFLDHPAYSD